MLDISEQTNREATYVIGDFWPLVAISAIGTLALAAIVIDIARDLRGRA